MSGGGGGGGGANLPIMSVYITTFYSFARSLPSAWYTVMVIANFRVLGGGGGKLTVMAIANLVDELYFHRGALLQSAG